MTEKELLEFAAKAAGVEFHSYINDPIIGSGLNRGRTDCGLWNPILDDGRALVLAIKLEISVEFDDLEQKTIAKWGDEKHLVHMWFNNGKEHATRKAIVRAAAEIGKAMP